MIRSRLSYANVVATLALFIALGGSSYAALKITGRNVKNNSLTGLDIRNGTLLAADFAGGSLPAAPRGLPVPSATRSAGSHRCPGPHRRYRHHR